MQIRNVPGKTSELGIGIIAIAIMILAGCGGGSSNPVTCPATGNVSGAEAVICFFADTSTTWEADLVNGLWAGTSSMVARTSISSFVATGANTYSFEPSGMDLATSSSAWSDSPISSLYYLTASGWVAFDYLAMVHTNNGNGTITSPSAPWHTVEVTAITRTDMNGQAVTCTDPLGSSYVAGVNGAISTVCPVAVTYPQGSASYTSTSSFTQSESYILGDSGATLTLTDGAGAALTELPSVLDTSFCIDGVVYDPIATPAPGADNYHVYSTYPNGTCTPSDINNTRNGAHWTVLISWKNTGNTAVPTVFDIKNVTDDYERIYADPNGKLMVGSYLPDYTSTSTYTGINKTAASAQLQANGLPPLP